MPLVTVNDQGVALAYEDTGAPRNSDDYTTVFLLHPYLWHGGIFRRMFPYAASNNLRLIAIHSREYCGSTPFLEQELELLHSSDLEDQANYVSSQAIDIARLIAHCIKHDNLPPPTESQGVRSGGVCLFAWSAGSAVSLALLANLTKLEESIYTLLDRYITTIILHDPPGYSYGISEPAKVYHPLKDLTLSLEQMQAAMVTWILTYFEPFADLALVTPPNIKARKSVSMTTMTPQDIAETTSKEAARRIGPGLVNYEVFAENLRLALFDTKGAWQNVKVIAAWGNMSMWSVPWAARKLADRLDEPAQPGEQRRDVQIVRLDNANHFFQHDHPEQMIRFIVEHIH
ncbi:alpha/beta-hydrolase [Trametopsis cervina]|nr:alpha/beta-hydrolase [Trametopsis cervina]